MPNNIKKTLKMVIVDVDGTLLNNDRVVSDANQEAINELIGQNTYFVMNTGALPKDGHRILTATSVGINPYTKWFIGLNGAVVYNLLTNDSFFEVKETNEQQIKEIFKRLNFKNYEVITLDERKYLHFIISNFDTWYTLGLEIYSFFEKESNKARGIENCLALINRFDQISIQKSEIIYFGDNINDLIVFQDPTIYCVAMGNAVDGLKKIADDQTTDNQQGISDYFKDKKSTFA